MSIYWGGGAGVGMIWPGIGHKDRHHYTVSITPGVVFSLFQNGV